MADRNVKVTVRADVADFLRGAGLVADASRKMGEGAKKAAQEAKTGLSGMAQSVRDNRDAFGQVGGALTAYGAAVVGLGVAVAKTGISYNTLRQTSVAALTTLTGSAEQANAQMDKLDAFATTSPFARDGFIKAQQQMLGFGIEAQKVIPYLDSIQNAVAAAGGSNHDIAELSRIFSQISASSKITATDLREFGNRGIDAATLIGSQMGKTGAQIREDITAGTLDAQVALDALAAGMEQRYAGAADNVKNTMLGAVDRVKAAFRDLSASAMDVFVSADGGGLAVDGLNALADAMRRFEDIPAGVRNTALALGALSGVAALAAGSFLLLAPRMVDTWDALGKMGTVGTRAQTGLRNVGTMAARAAGPLMLGALVVTLSKVGQGMLDTGESTEVLENRLRTLGAGSDLDGLLQGAGGIEDFNAALRETGSDGLWAGIQRGVTDFGDGLLALATGGQDGRTEITRLRDALPGLDEALSQVAATSREDAVAAFGLLADQMGLNRDGMGDLIAQMPAFRDYLTGVATEMGLAGTDATLLAIALGEIAPGMATAAESADAFANALVLLPEGAPSYLDRLKESAASMADAIEVAAGGFVNFGDSIGDAEVSLDGWFTKIEKQLVARADYLDNIAFLQAAGVNEAFLLGLAEEGAAGEQRAQQMVDAITGGDTAVVARANEIGDKMGSSLVESTAAAISQAEFPSVEFEATLNENSLHHAVLYGHEVIEGSEPALLPVGTDLSPAEQERARWVVETAATMGITKLDSNPELAYRQIEEWNNYARTVEGMPLLNANPALAQMQLDRWRALAAITEGVAILNANQAPAGSVVAGWQSMANLAFGTATLYANSGPAEGTLAWFLSQIPSSVSITLRAVSTVIGSIYDRADGGPINRASGGPVHGPGGPRDDLVPAYNTMTGQAYRLSNGEHILTTAEVDALGGHGEVYRMRKAMLAGAVRYDIGGAVGAAYQSRQVYSAPMHAAPVAAAGPSHVDTGQIAAAVSGAMSSWQPMVSIDGRQFHGVMLKAAAGARRAGA